LVSIIAEETRNFEPNQLLPLNDFKSIEDFVDEAVRDRDFCPNVDG
jgi:hypothetical protein